MKPYLLREEKGGGGYFFSLRTGEVSEIESAAFKHMRTRDDVGVIPLGTPCAQKARSAPFCVWVELTRKCNLSCVYCGEPDRGERERLDTDEFIQIFKDLAASGVFEVRMTGGEPTLVHEFPRIVEAASEASLFVSLNSNGLWSNDQRETYSRLPVQLLIISLDGPKEVHNRLRESDSYDEVITSIVALVRAGKRVRINTVLCQENKKSLAALVEEVDRLGVEALTLVPLRPAGRGAGQTFASLQLSPDEYGAVLMEVRALRRAHPRLEIAASYDVMSEGKIFNTPGYFTKRCVAGVEAACISPQGDLRACILLDASPYIIGNVVREAFGSLWAEDSRWGVFRDDGRLSERCRQCSLFADRCPGTCQAIAAHYGSPEVDPYCQL